MTENHLDPRRFDWAGLVRHLTLDHGLVLDPRLLDDSDVRRRRHRADVLHEEEHERLEAAALKRRDA